MLARALGRLKERTGTLRGKAGVGRGAVVRGADSAELRPLPAAHEARPPGSAGERMMQRLLANELRREMGLRFQI